MTIELNFAVIICVASCIITVGGAIKVLSEAKIIKWYTLK